MSEPEEPATPMVDLPPMRLLPRLLKDEVCLQVIQKLANIGFHKLTDALFAFRRRFQLA